MSDSYSVMLIYPKNGIEIKYRVWVTSRTHVEIIEREKMKLIEQGVNPGDIIEQVTLF